MQQFNEDTAVMDSIDFFLSVSQYFHFFSGKAGRHRLDD